MTRRRFVDEPQVIENTEHRASMAGDPSSESSNTPPDDHGDYMALADETSEAMRLFAESRGIEF